ncbi:energy transducer TonB [Pseudomonas sp. CCC3.1]|uniref:energy transducer TonB n=1 Tax=Pseudomonas sp. CCC3.1 TaxID=3048607 RepID=UPI002AC96C8A|nr:energy transducer TonB [Pseudomonas sp. CCC3.1]MEB0208173.1 energy transducer TonB [Pseudomonas sp. CCC3.1]WPX38573.1 energy transducer TonB [Pseudomonas sp. CCC3.1]
MSDEVKHKERPAPLLGAERVQQWTHIPHVPNTSQPGGLSKPHILLLIGVVAVLHGSAWWFFQQSRPAPVITPPEIPEMTVELTSPAPPAPPVEEPPPPPPPPPEPEAPQEDEDAVKEPPPKPVEKPKPIEKPKPVVKPKPVQKPQPPKPAPPAPAAPAAPTAPTAPAAPAAAPGPVKETAAVSGLASLGNPPPEYPALALRRNWEGSVGLKIKVLPNGRAGSVEVIKSSGKQALDDAAVAAVRNWKFVPAKRGDTPIEGFATQTIAFKLPE